MDNALDKAALLATIVKHSRSALSVFWEQFNHQEERVKESEFLCSEVAARLRDCIHKASGLFEHAYQCLDEELFTYQDHSLHHMHVYFIDTVAMAEEEIQALRSELSVLTLVHEELVNDMDIVGGHIQCQDWAIAALETPLRRVQNSPGSHHDIRQRVNRIAAAFPFFAHFI